jgi:hypothetical protein
MTTTPRSPGSPKQPVQSSAGLLVFAWLFVGLPLAWGVMQTIIKSLALFH